MKKMTFIILFFLSLIMVTDNQVMAKKNEETVSQNTDTAVVSGNESETGYQLRDGKPGEGNIDDILAYWSTNGYPEDISFAYHAGGEMLDDGSILAYWEIGIVNADEDRKQEVVAMLSHNCRITFYDCDYSYRERQTIYNELIQDENIKQIVMGLNTQYIYIVVEPSKLQSYSEDMYQQYGTLVSVSDENGITTDDTVLTDGLHNKGGLLSNTWLLVLLMLLMTAFVIAFLERDQLSGMLRYNKGNKSTIHYTVSKQEVVRAIRENEVTPHPDLLLEIKKKMNQEH